MVDEWGRGSRVGIVNFDRIRSNASARQATDLQVGDERRPAEPAAADEAQHVLKAVLCGWGTGGDRVRVVFSDSIPAQWRVVSIPS